MRATLLAITPGDPDGIGPEITWKAICTGQYSSRGISLICIGARSPFEKLKAPITEVSEEELKSSAFLKYKGRPCVFLIPAPKQKAGGTFHLEGFQSGWAIQKATELVKNGSLDALVTGPISKERLQQGGYLYPGHTEFLADLCETQSGVPQVTMMLANRLLRVSLVTTHVGIKDVSSVLTREKIHIAARNTAEGLTRFWGISRPRIAITALNPHAGEAGLFGREEIEVIEPEISSLQKEYKTRIEFLGPFPADTLFAKHVLNSRKERWDAVICMYHDQGLIPVKLLDFHESVNITLGLPIVRTSVDHGVGFDIAGKGIADASSLMAAINLASQMVGKAGVKKLSKTKLTKKTQSKK